MPDLKVWKWERFVPNIGENRTCERPFFFRVKSGVSKVEFKAFLDKLVEASAGPEDKRWAGVIEAFSTMVELGDEPLSIAGQPVTTVGEYMNTIAEHTTSEPFFELRKAIIDLNSYGGTEALFYERPSGGTPTTRSPATARATGRTDAPSAGKQTSV